MANGRRQPTIEYADEVHTLRVRIPTATLAAVGLAYALLMTNATDDSESTVQGGLVWMLDWDIGSESHERVGLRLLNSTRGEGASGLLTEPCQLFDAGEFVALHTAFSLPLLFGWDAYVIGSSTTFISRISHEGFIDLRFRNSSALADMQARLHRGMWELG